MLLNVLQYTELPLQPRIIQPKTLVMPWLEGYSAPQPHHLPSTEINVTDVFLGHSTETYMRSPGNHLRGLND